MNAPNFSIFFSISELSWIPHPSSFRSFLAFNHSHTSQCNSTTLTARHLSGIHSKSSPLLLHLSFIFENRSFCPDILSLPAPQHLQLKFQFFIYQLLLLILTLSTSSWKMTMAAVSRVAPERLKRTGTSLRLNRSSSDKQLTSQCNLQKSRRALGTFIEIR